jgi:hypothetical protein
MNTISQHLADRQAERRKDYFLPIMFFMVGAIFMSIVAAVLAVAMLKTAGIVEDARARAYCEGAVCAGPSW